MVIFPSLSLHAPAYLAPRSSTLATVRPQVLSSCSNASQGLEQLDTQKGLNKLLHPELVNTLEAGGVGWGNVWRKEVQS